MESIREGLIHRPQVCRVHHVYDIEAIRHLARESERPVFLQLNAMPTRGFYAVLGNSATHVPAHATRLDLSEAVQASLCIRGRERAPADITFAHEENASSCRQLRGSIPYGSKQKTLGDASLDSVRDAVQGSNTPQPPPTDVQLLDKSMIQFQFFSLLRSDITIYDSAPKQHPKKGDTPPSMAQNLERHQNSAQYNDFLRLWYHCGNTYQDSFISILLFMVS